MSWRTRFTVSVTDSTGTRSLGEFKSLPLALAANRGELAVTVKQAKITWNQIDLYTMGYQHGGLSGKITSNYPLTASMMREALVK